MLKNYLKTAFRYLWRNKGYSLINILGLAVGVACCLLITIYVRDEMGFDKFHEKETVSTELGWIANIPSILVRMPLFHTPMLRRSKRSFRKWRK